MIFAHSVVQQYIRISVPNPTYQHVAHQMTMMDDFLAERGATANGRPLDNTNPADNVPGNRILRFGENPEQMEHDEATQAPYDQSSNMYLGNSRNGSVSNSPLESS